MNAVILTVVLLASIIFVPWGLGHFVKTKILKDRSIFSWFCGFVSLLGLSLAGLGITGLYNLALWLLR